MAETQQKKHGGQRLMLMLLTRSDQLAEQDNKEGTKIRRKSDISSA